MATTTSKHKKYQKLVKMRGRRRFRAQILLWAAAFVAAFYLFTFREVPVLMYHFIGTQSEAQNNSLIVSKNAFDRQLSMIKNWGYKIYTLDEFYAVQKSGRYSFRKGVVITFDDGNIGFLTGALPILEKYQAPAANFMVTESMRQESNGSMSVENARELAQNPLITLGAHTAHHLILVGQPEKILREEILDAKHDLEKMIGKEVLYFAYPGGFLDDAAVQMVKAAGFKMAFTTSWKRLRDRTENDYSVTRVKITEKDVDPVRFWYKVSGFYTLLKRLQSAF